MFVFVGCQFLTFLFSFTEPHFRWLTTFLLSRNFEEIQILKVTLKSDSNQRQELAV